ncbi:MAG: sigma 54-interacting transcriptional regulator [Syntrophobacterales bacterium]|nr:sigma 54-interacting transcriptional regulator [Syntrophobacterales bacterium]
MAQEAEKGSLHPLSPSAAPPPTFTLGTQVQHISPEPFRTMVEVARDGICLVDITGTIVFVNQGFARLLGREASQLTGRSLFEVVVPEHHDLLSAKLERRRRGLSDLYEMSLQHQGGRVVPTMVSAAPIMAEGRFLGSVAIFTDISERKRVERELRETGEFLETVINSITDNLLAIDPRSCRIILANQSFLSRIGQDRESVYHRPCFEVLHQRQGPCQDSGLFCPVQESAKQKRQVLVDKNFVNVQGQLRTYQIAAYPHFTPGGEVDLVICLERDVTDRRKMEEALAFRSRELQKTQVQLEKLFDIARERSAKRSAPELLQFLHGLMLEAFPGSEPIFFLLEGEQRLLSLEECASELQDAQRRLVRRLDQAGLLGDFLRRISALLTPQVITFADPELPPYFKLFTTLYPSWLAMPILAHQESVGLFLLGFHHHQSFSREDLHFCHACFAQVGCYLRYLLRQKGREMFPEAGLPEVTGYGEIIGQSKKMQEVYQLINLVSGTDATVLITGENGTGKELVARTIHRQSKRSRGPFVVANCSAYSPTLLESELFGHEKGAFTGAIRRKKGRFELAQGGTLFLDEIGDIPPATQVLLLRFLQDHCFERVGGEVTIEADVRVLAATNKDLYREAQQGRFRDDLYYRLNVITIHLPPLRERKEDIPLLCQHFLTKYNLKEGKKISKFSPDAMQALMDFDWPGNVRQLENAISHAVILAQGEIIRRRHLPRFLKEESEEAVSTSLAETERRLILRVLKESSWNKHEAARRLRVSRSTLYSKIRRYGLSQGPLEGSESGQKVIA